MKPLFAVFLILALAACGSPAPTAELPTAAAPQPTQTPMVVVQTVVVTVIPTNAPTEAPTPLPAPTDVPPTQAPTEIVQPVAPATDVGNPVEGPVAVDDSFGAGWFAEMTRTRNDFSLRCTQNKEISFSVKPLDPKITQVDFYYRIQDRSTGAIFDWQNAGRMIRNTGGSFTLTFSGENVNANFRKPNAWFDYQFIGSSGSGVVGRSEKIEQQVTYTFDCQ